MGLGLADYEKRPSRVRLQSAMNEKYMQAFALAYMIGWFLARLSRQK
jgi:hypothetical protein